MLSGAERIAHVGTATALRDFDTADVGSGSFSAIRPCMFNVRLARDSEHWADMRGQVKLKKGPLQAALSLLQRHKVKDNLRAR